jgi:mRNA interferase MazF
MYWVKDPTSVGVEEWFKRPFLIISSDKGNETSPSVLGASMTTKSRWGIINVPVNAGGRKSTVMCNQVYCIDKSRLGNYIGTATEEEMAEIDRGLRFVLDLMKEPTDSEDWRDKRIADLEEQIAAQADVKTTEAVERDMWKRMYEKALELLAGKKVAETTETPKAVEPVIVEKPKVAEEKPVEEKLVEEKLVDVNTGTERELRDAGCSLEMIHNIVERRPFKSLEELKTLPNVTRIGYQIVSQRLTCVPVLDVKWKKDEPRKAKVNVNTAKATEIKEATGMNLTTAYAICGHRKKHGRYEKLDDLLNVKSFGEICMKRYGAMLEV